MQLLPVMRGVHERKRWIVKEYLEKELLIQEIKALRKSFFLPAVFERIVNELPIAEVRPASKADWMGEGDGYADGEMVYDVWSCSCCGFTVDEGEDSPPEWNYCPNCGAEFEKEKGE